MRQARIIFDESTLNCGNVTAKDLLEIMELLPDNAKIKAIGSTFVSHTQSNGFITVESDYFVDTPLGTRLPDIVAYFSATSSTQMIEYIDYGKAFDQNVVGGHTITLLCGKHHYFSTAMGFDGKIYASGSKSQTQSNTSSFGSLPMGYGHSQPWTPSSQGFGIYTLPGFSDDPEQMNFNFGAPAETSGCQHTFAEYHGFIESYKYCTKCDKRE